MIEYLDPEQRLVIEIGPGGGVLTRELLSAETRVLAIELDLEWAFEMRRRLSDTELRLIVGDAVDLDWSGVQKGTLVTGNLPFGVSTRLIDRVLDVPGRVPRAAFMVQKEVADRLLAQPGDRSYGALSVLTAARSEATFLGRVAPGSFRPPPKVEAALVGFQLHYPSVGSELWPSFASMVHLAFSQRRKQLHNVLASSWTRPVADRILEQAELPRAARAQELSLSDFVRLFDCLNTGSEGDLGTE